jgi:hypothetical protein
MADLGDMLMNQIKQSNLAQTQLATDYSNQANTLAQMPQANPMNDFMGSLSMGVLGAPSHLSTMEAIGQAMPGAQNAFQQTQQQNANRMTQAMEYKRLAASTLSAVAKFNLEYGLKREELGVKHAHNQETARHNKATEYNQMLQHSNKPTLEEEIAKKHVMQLIQEGNEASFNKDAIEKQLHAAQNTNRLNKASVIAAGKNLPSSDRADTGSYFRSSDESAKEIQINNLVKGTLGYMTKKWVDEGKSFPEILNLVNEKKSEVREAAEREVSGARK